MSTIEVYTCVKGTLCRLAPVETECVVALGVLVSLDEILSYIKTLYCIFCCVIVIGVVT